MRTDQADKNVRITRQIFELDNETGVKFEHLSGVLNTGTEGLSRHEILDEIPGGTLEQLCEVLSFLGSLT